MPPTTRKTRNTSLQPTSNTTALDTPAQSTRRSTRSTSLRPTSSRADTKRSSIPPAAVKTSASASGTDTAEASPAPASLHSEDEQDEEETPSSSSSTSTFVKVERIDEDMLSSATGQRTGLRGRNVEDVSELEEKGLLRHVDYDDDGSERETRRRDKGKEKETRVERVADYSDGSDEGLNNPRDRNAFALLVLLYLLQGIPLGLTFGTLPFIMKPHLSYSQLAVFSLSTWPYSLKLLWSPIVDAWFVPRWGRRKSWIVPVQAIVGVGLWYIGGRVESWLDTDEINVRFITLIFGSLILAAATQDIAVDGWALTLLSQQNLSYASTAQTIGLGIGNALAFTVFLAFNSPDFSNRYFRTEPQIYGLVSLGGYLRFWAVIFIIVTVGIAYFKTEDAVSEDDPDMDVRKVYSVMWSIIRLKNIQAFLVVLIVCKIGFQVNDSVTGLKLLEKGLLKEDLAVAVLLDFPIQMAAGWLVATWSRPKTGSARHPLTTSGTGDILRPWLLAFWARLAMAIIGSLVVWGFPKSGKVEGGYFGFVVATTLLSSLTSTVQFVGMSAFFTQIADPLIGGTYMTLLNTISNLGGTLPKPLVLRSVDLLTYGTCSVPIKDPSVLNNNCVNDPGRHLCNELGGHCIIQRDGYYIMNVVCVALGAFSLIYYILPTVKRLQALPMSAWRVKIPN